MLAERYGERIRCFTPPQREREKERNDKDMSTVFRACNDNQHSDTRRNDTQHNNTMRHSAYWKSD
jgi:hypothetical protein